MSQSPFRDWHDVLVEQDFGLQLDTRHGKGAWRSTYSVVCRISDYMDGDGYCFVGRDKLASEIHLDVKAVGHAITRLEVAGVLVVLRSKGGRKNDNDMWATFPVEDGRRLFDGFVVPLKANEKGGVIRPPFSVKKGGVIRPPFSVKKGGVNGKKGGREERKRGAYAALKGGVITPVEALEVAESDEALATSSRRSADAALATASSEDLECVDCGTSLDPTKCWEEWDPTDDDPPAPCCYACWETRNTAGRNGPGWASVPCDGCGGPRGIDAVEYEGGAILCADCAKRENLPATKDHEANGSVGSGQEAAALDPDADIDFGGSA